MFNFYICDKLAKSHIRLNLLNNGRTQNESSSLLSLLTNAFDNNSQSESAHMNANPVNFLYKLAKR